MLNDSNIKLFFLAAVLFIAGCEQVPDRPLQIAAHLWPGYEFLFFAKQEGWLNKRQVNLTETSSATSSLQALKQGEVDGAALTLDEVLLARDAGINLVIVLVFDISAGADMLLAKPGFKHLSELKGARIGLEQGTLGEVVLAQALKAAGLTRSEVKLVPLTIDNHQVAWQQAKVDALVTYEPSAGKLLSSGAVKLFDSRKMPNMIVDVLAVRREVLATHQTEIRHLIASHFQAMQHFYNNYQDASYRMAAHLKVLPEDVSKNYKGLFLPGLKYNLDLISGAEPSLLGSAYLLSSIMLESKILAQPANIEGLIDDSFLIEQALMKSE